MKDYTQDCYNKAIGVLKANSTKSGILASGNSPKAKGRSYRSVFGRDASICSMGMVLSKDKDLIMSAKRSLETLAKYQADNGQISFWVKPEKKQADFYYLGSIDSTLWWLIAIKFFDKNTKYNLSKKLTKQIKKAINWLECQEHPNFYLLSQNEGSDWADLMPRTGFVLYSNSLWYWLKRMYGLDKADQTKEYFNYIFDRASSPSKKVCKENSRLEKLLSHIKKDKKDPSYLSFVNYTFYGTEGDVFGNILACLVGLADDKKTEEVIDYLLAQNANKPHPIKATLRPITRKDNIWRPYMGHLNLNKVNEYHNGGIWPFIGGFWVMLLNIFDQEISYEALNNLAKLNKQNNWQFNEWFHGGSGKAMGMPKQSWNAAMFILAYKSLNN